MNYLVFLFLQLAFISVPASVTFLDCGSAYDLQAVNIRGCGRSSPCYVTLGENVPVNLVFKADFVSLNLDQDVTIYMNYLNLRTEVSPERCEIYECPVSTGTVTSFTSVMSIPENLVANQRGSLRWRVENEAGKQVLCYTVAVQTQTRLQKLLRQFLKTDNTIDTD